MIENNTTGLRKLPGTKLLNQATGESVYVPPQDYDTIVRLMDNLQAYINDDALSATDPLIKMAVIRNHPSFL